MLEEVVVDTTGEATVLFFRMSEPLKLSVTPTPHRLRIELPPFQSPPGFPQGLNGLGYIDSLRLRRDPGGDWLEVFAHPSTDTFDVLETLRPPGFRVYLNGSESQISRRGMATLRVRQVDPTAPARIRRIVIDPGHGGRDPGTIGVNGAREKDVVLAIAKELARILETSGFSVAMTREDDRFVPLGRRSEVANRIENALFISIHANANRSRRIRGMETYVLSQSKTEEARLVASFENSSIRFEVPDGQVGEDLDLILVDLAQNAFLQESTEWAVALQSSAGQRLSVEDRGVRQAGFYVLYGVAMPSVLVEVGYLSNPTEAGRLSESSYQREVARSLEEGIRAYLTAYHRKISGS